MRSCSRPSSWGSSSVAISVHSRLCTSCRRLLPEPPAPPTCGHCGRTHVLVFSEWPLVLRWWLAAEHLNVRFYPWKSPQSVWEDLLRDTFNGSRWGSAGPNRRYPEFSMDATPEQVYARALVEADKWKLAGRPLGPIITLDSQAAA